MEYAKFIEGRIWFSPRMLREDAVTIYNPTPEMLMARGYKPVQYTEAPEVEEGWAAHPSWTETEAEILQVWIVEPESDIPDAEVMDILLGGEVQ